MDKFVVLDLPRRNTERKETNVFTLDEAREIVGSKLFYSDDEIITACSVIEEQGETSERSDFRALREVLAGR